jgi:dTDP-4-dehydrorhamnose 3,5-epimerase
VNFAIFKTDRLYIPKGLVHGVQTLDEETEVFYQMSEFYYPECARGVRGDAPAFQIEWPIKDLVISAKDQSWPLYQGLLSLE